MNDKVQEALQMLYTARWNVPRAAFHCGIPNQEMMEKFNKWLLGGESLPEK